MELPIVVAKIMAIYYLVIGFGMLTGMLDLKKMMKDFEDSTALSLITGFILLVLGGLLVQYHNVWVKDWTVLITLIGWAMLLKGILYILHPRFLFSWGRKLISSHHHWGVVVLLLGLLFGYLGFMA